MGFTSWYSSTMRYFSRSEDRLLPDAIPGRCFEPFHTRSTVRYNRTAHVREAAPVHVQSIEQFFWNRFEDDVVFTEDVQHLLVLANVVLVPLELRSVDVRHREDRTCENSE